MAAVSLDVVFSWRIVRSRGRAGLARALGCNHRAAVGEMNAARP